MRISSFNINKFCGAYGSLQKGGYYNPRNLDFKTKIKGIVDSLLTGMDDIVVLQEFIDNQFINVSQLFEQSRYEIFANSDYKRCKSNVVAITLKDSGWKKVDLSAEAKPQNKLIKMKHPDKNILLLGLHNTGVDIKKQISKEFQLKEADIILGDFNDQDWLSVLSNSDEYRGLVPDEVITYKPGQTTIDQIFIRKSIDSKRIAFKLIETFTSDHNILSFELDSCSEKQNYIRDRSSNIHLSLHDSRIQKLEVNQNSLQLTMDRIFQYKQDEERSYSGVIEFTKTDVEECNILVFDNPYGYDGERSFSGRSYSLDEYKEKFPSAEFEIVTEGYNGYDTSYQGWIWTEESNPLFGIMNIWNTGDMIYKIDTK